MAFSPFVTLKISLGLESTFKGRVSESKEFLLDLVSVSDRADSDFLIKTSRELAGATVVSEKRRMQVLHCLPGVAWSVSTSKSLGPVSVSTSISLGLISVSTSTSLGLVSVSIHSSLVNVLVGVVLTAT